MTTSSSSGFGDPGRRGAVWLVLAGIASVQAGAAAAKYLFPLAPPDTVVWLRLLFAAVVLWAAARPRLRGRSRADLLTALGFGAAMAGMNWAIYHSFARIPLGIAVTIEFLGPLAIAVAGSRRLLDLVWVALAGAGVLLLGLSPVTLDPLGVAFALLAGACWAGYILLSQRTGRRWPGLDGLAVGATVGAVALAAPALIAAADAPGGTSVLLDPRVLGLGLVIAVLSSVLPYSFELVALRRIPPRLFGILMSLEPAAAAVAGLLLLGELLGVTDWLALACVVAASLGATRTSRRPEPSAPVVNE